MRASILWARCVGESLGVWVRASILWARSVGGASILWARCVGESLYFVG